MAGQGRHSEYTPEIGDEICEIVSTTTKGLPAICLENPQLPNQATINKWRIRHPDFGNNYARAKQIQAELLAEEIIDISDDGRNDTYENDDGYEVTNHDVIARSKLRVDSRKWLAAKLAPKIYGDKTDDTSSPQDTLTKIQALVADLNKTNVSDI